MRQVIRPNQEIEVATLEEISELLEPQLQVERIRAPGNVPLDAGGNGTAVIYTVPAMCKFELRRVSFTLAGNIPTDPTTAAVSLAGGGHWIAYLRSETLIEYAQPYYGASLQVPGVQTWSSQQGPELRNKEVLRVQCLGVIGVSNALSVYAEGILSGPRST